MSISGLEGHENEFEVCEGPIPHLRSAQFFRSFALKGVDAVDAAPAAACHTQSTNLSMRFLTGDVPDAGTDSHVFITIHGERGDTQEQELDDIQQNFQRGAVEQFTVVGTDGGRIIGISIRHDNTFNRKVWFLKQVTVEDAYSNEHAIFDCNNWLALDRGPKTIDVELKPD
jgi:hypothetical protein